MKPSIAFASTLLFSLMMIPIAPTATRAQTSPQTPPSVSGGTVPPAPPQDAPAVPGSQSVGSAESEATGIATQIEQARKQGKDVSKAEAEEKQGEAALQGGYKAEAAQHFNRAKEDLGTM